MTLDHLPLGPRARIVAIDWSLLADDEAPPPVPDAVSLLAQRSGLEPFGVPSLAQSPRVFERALVAASSGGRLSTATLDEVLCVKQSQTTLR